MRQMTDLAVSSALTCHERALLVDLSDGCGGLVKIRVTAGHVPRPAYVDGRAVATDRADMTPGRFVLADGCLTHLPVESGHWGLAFEIMGGGDRSVFVVGYSEKQKTQNGGRPYTTATVMPTGCRNGHGDANGLPKSSRRVRCRGHVYPTYCISI